MNLVIIGNDAFASYFATLRINSTRLVNGGDIVTHLPPELLNYHHVPLEVWFHNDDYVTCDESGNDPTHT